MATYTSIPRRVVFISYHHDVDRPYYDSFSNYFSATHRLIRDNSLDRLFDSDDAEYVMRRIREKYISGSSCTIVLCGADTYKRKYIDWEVCATLNQQGGLIGINLPTNPKLPNGNYKVPNRFYDNWRSGYAVWVQWTDVEMAPAALTGLIEDALARRKSLIDNSRPTMRRNL